MIEAQIRLYGLVLVGGHSTRMGSDKAQLIVGNGNLKLYEQAEQNLKTVCERVFLSIRSNQQQLYAGYELIIDSQDYTDIGPAHGLLSAYDAYPESTWLVFACDFPLATAEAFKQLAENYKEPATCFIHKKDNHPDPFFAIWSPKALEQLKQNVLTKGKNGPCSALMQSIGLGGKNKDAVDVNQIPHYIRPKNDKWLVNTNTKEEWDAALSA